MSSTENRDSLPPAWSRDDAEPRPLAADSVARKLREARTDADRDLDDIAHALRIRYDYLLAIEEGRFEDLPGPTYAVGFVRAYADYLRLDTEDIATRFKAEVADFTRRTELVFPTPEPETRVPGSLIFLVSAVLIVGAYGVWYFSSSGPDQVALPPRVDEIPEAPPVGVPAAGAPAPRSSPDVADLPEAPPGFVDPSDSAPSLAGPPVPNPGVDPGVDAEPAPGARVAAADPAANPVGPPLPAAAGRGLSAAQDDTDRDHADRDDRDGESLAAADAAPPAAEAAEATAQEISAQEASAATDSAAPVADQAAADPAASDSFDDADAQEAATVVLVPGAETDETEVDAAPAPEAETETADSETVQQREGVTIAPLPPQAPERRPLAQPDPVQTAALGEPEPEAPAVYGAVNGESRIVVRAIYDSYVLIRDADDKLILTKVLRRGESYRVPDQQGLTMLTGNAGGLQIEVDGEATPSVGAVGAIVRNINLDPARLKSGNATAP